MATQLKTLNDWLEWQQKLHPANIDFKIERIKSVFNRLGINRIADKIIIIAGTNGKGSTVSILESILYESDYKVGSYTSPHLLSFNERIKIDKVPVKTNSICDAFESIEETTAYLIKSWEADEEIKIQPPQVIPIAKGSTVY